MTTSPHREATALGTASGKGRCLRTFFKKRRRHTYFSMPLTHKLEDLKMTEHHNNKSVSAALANARALSDQTLIRPRDAAAMAAAVLSSGESGAGFSGSFFRGLVGNHSSDGLSRLIG